MSSSVRPVSHAQRTGYRRDLHSYDRAILDIYASIGNLRDGAMSSEVVPVVLCKQFIQVKIYERILMIRAMKSCDITPHKNGPLNDFELETLTNINR